jgi:acyl-CoA synthetase (AMP-forming)/AMP-acid ligase II
MHTPYGATECLPVATIEAAEVLGETALKMDEGAGVCVGRRFDSIDWQVIRITDGPIAMMDDAESLPVGEIGELVVRGPQASPRYVTRVECNADVKISSTSERAGRSCAPHGGEDAPARFEESNAAPWHRMGDVGYLDDAGRFWYCGRKSHRVETERGPLYTECVEAIFNAHHWVGRTALVGLGRAGRQTPVLIVEPSSETFPPSLPHDLIRFAKGTSRHTAMIRNVLILGKLPVDVRHNAKINRELLAEWAATKLPELV